MGYKKQVKVNTEKGNTLVKVVKDKLPENQIVFSFSFFNGSSIRLRDFNNYYANNFDAMKSVYDFFETLKQISNMGVSQFYSVNMQTQFHYNEFDDNNIIDRIETILIDGYGMTQSKVNQFERLYFEFSFGNGKRAIGTKIYNNVFEILFIDCNHMVCIESSRAVKVKTKYNYPSVFGRIDRTISVTEFEREDLLNMLMASAKNGEYDNIEDLIKDYEELYSWT